MTVRTPLAVLIAVAIVLAACGSPTRSPSTTGIASAAPPIPDATLYGTAVGTHAPGDLLAAEELGAPEGMRAWAISYATSGIDGRPVAATGMILAPAAAPTARDVVALGHWSVGIADRCAPSRHGVGAGSALAIVGVPFVRAGAVVVAPDYPGLGTPGPAAFLVGSLEGGSMLDAVRAARSLEAVHAGARVALVGHSQGGQAALWAGQLAADRAPELEVVGVAAASPVGDLVETARAGFAGAIGRSAWINAAELVASWSDLYGLDGAPLLTDAGRSTAAALRDACPGDVAVDGPTIATSPLEDSLWRGHLAAESAGQAPIPAPVWIVHGAKDPLVPITSSRNVADDLCDRGTSVTLETLPGVDHLGTILGSGRVAAMVTWVEERFAGTPLPDGC